MPTAVCQLTSASPYSPANFIMTLKNDNESDREWETRCWRERIHTNKAGQVVIPSTQFSGAIKTAASYLNIKIPGERNRTFTKHFDSGVMVFDPLELPLTPDDVEGEWLMLHAQPGSMHQTRVAKCMPRIDEWNGVVTYTILDPKITKHVFAEVLAFSGSQIGIGRWRPAKKGTYGRYRVTELDWQAETRDF